MALVTSEQVAPSNRSRTSRGTVAGGAGAAPSEGMRSAVQDIGRRFRSGDRVALREAYDNWGGLVLSLAQRTLHDRHDAEDVVQETFVAAWHGRQSFDAERGILPAWLTGVARNKIKDRLRSRHRVPTPVDPDRQRPRVADDALDAVDRVAESLVLRDALDRLSPPQRQVLELSFYGEHPHGDIAVMLDLPLGTVKSHARRGLQSLQRHLGDRDG